MDATLLDAPVLPDAVGAGTFVGRIWDPAAGGPSPVLVRGDQVIGAWTRPTMRRDPAS